MLSEEELLQLYEDVGGDLSTEIIGGDWTPPVETASYSDVTGYEPDPTLAEYAPSIDEQIASAISDWVAPEDVQAAVDEAPPPDVATEDPVQQSEDTTPTDAAPAEEPAPTDASSNENSAPQDQPPPEDVAPTIEEEIAQLEQEIAAEEKAAQDVAPPDTAPEQSYPEDIAPPIVDQQSQPVEDPTPVVDVPASDVGSPIDSGTSLDVIGTPVDTPVSPEVAINDILGGIIDVSSPEPAAIDQLPPEPPVESVPVDQVWVDSPTAGEPPVSPESSVSVTEQQPTNVISQEVIGTGVEPTPTVSFEVQPPVSAQPDVPPSFFDVIGSQPEQPPSVSWLQNLSTLIGATDQGDNINYNPWVNPNPVVEPIAQGEPATPAPTPAVTGPSNGEAIMLPPYVVNETRPGGDPEQDLSGGTGSGNIVSEPKYGGSVAATGAVSPNTPRNLQPIPDDGSDYAKAYNAELARQNEIRAQKGLPPLREYDLEDSNGMPGIKTLQDVVVKQVAEMGAQRLSDLEREQRNSQLGSNASYYPPIPIPIPGLSLPEAVLATVVLNKGDLSGILGGSQPPSPQQIIDNTTSVITGFPGSIIGTGASAAGPAEAGILGNLANSPGKLLEGLLGGGAILGGGGAPTPPGQTGAPATNPVVIGIQNNNPGPQQDLGGANNTGPNTGGGDTPPVIFTGGGGGGPATITDSNTNVGTQGGPPANILDTIIGANNNNTVWGPPQDTGGNTNPVVATIIGGTPSPDKLPTQPPIVVPPTQPPEQPPVQPPVVVPPVQPPPPPEPPPVQPPVVVPPAVPPSPPPEPPTIQPPVVVPPSTPPGGGDTPPPTQPPVVVPPTTPPTTGGGGTIPPIVITPVSTTPVTVAPPTLNRDLYREGSISNPAYAQLAGDTMDNYGRFSGMPGQSDIRNFMALLPQLQQYNQGLTGMASAQTQGSNTALRQANIGDVLGLSGMANAANRMNNSELYGLLGAQAGVAGQQLGTDWAKMQNQGALSGEDLRSAQQSAREAYASRGQLGGNSSIAAEVLNRDALMRQRQQEARANYQQSYQNAQAPISGYTANKFDPFSTILGGQYGQQTQNVGTNQNLFGQGSQFSSGQLSNQFVQQQINPWSQYASDVYGSNFNAENARNISQANANAAIQGANLNMIGQGTGALLGFLGKLWGGS